MSQYKQPVIWILVADGEHARVVKPDHVEGRFVTVLPLGLSEHPHYPPGLHQDPRPLDKLRFATEVAHRLNQEAEQGNFDRLVIVAPGHIVHGVREALSKLAASRLIGTMSKDLTHLNDHDLSPHLAEWWMVRGDPLET